MRWTEECWLAGFREWIDGEVAAAGLRPTGPVEQPHARPWATALRVPTDGGLLWAKASLPVFRHEAALTVALAEWLPDRMTEVVAADTERNWLLTRHAGETVRERIAAGDAGVWEPVLAAYAGAQVALTPRVPELLALGVPDLRLEVLPARYDDVVARNGPAELRALGPAFGDLCARLAESGPPDTLEHDDFHDGNVFVRDGQVRLADWGDAVVTHPFVSLTVFTRATAHRRGVAEDGPEIAALRDDYIRSFGTDLPSLRVTAAVAVRVGLVVRALTWDNLVRALDGEERAEFAGAVPSYLRAFGETLAGSAEPR